MYQKRILLFHKRRSKSNNDVKRKAETDSRKHRNIHGPLNGSSKSIAKDVQTSSSLRRTRSSVKLNIENEIPEDENGSTSENHDTDLRKIDLEPDSTQPEIQHSRPLEISQPSNEKQATSVIYNGLSKGAGTVVPDNHETNNEQCDEYNQITPNLPQIMSTRGSPRNDGLYPVGKIYKSSRTYPIGIQNLSHDQKPHHAGKTYRPSYNKDSRGGGVRHKYHHSRYEAETQSTWTLNYVEKTKKKYTTSAIEDYYMPRESYMTMVGLTGSKDKETYDEKIDYYKNNTRIEAADSRTDIEKGTGIHSSVDDERLTPPPELIRVGESSNQSVKSDSSIPLLDRNDTREVNEEDIKVEVDDNEHVTSSTNVLEYANPADSLDGEETDEKPKFAEIRSPGLESNSTLDTSNDQDIDDFAVKENLDNKYSSEIHLLPHHQLSEAAIEQMITVPVTGGDSSWKHAKQVYSCPLCAKVFPFKSKLQRHVLVHTRIKPYKCTVCGRGFTQQIDLQRHLTRHTGEKPFKCHLCSAQFIRADNLRKHCKDAHYIVIEEPIRKRRRRTTGSDTVLPSLEVAIALAFSETERNGGRVLGRTVTRSNPRNARTNNQFNKTLPNPPPDMPALVGEHSTGMFTHSPGRQSAQEQITAKYHGKVTDQHTQGTEVKPPFPTHQRKGIISSDMLRLYENGSPSAGYLSAPDYDRNRDIDSKEYLIRMRGDKRQIMSPEHRYKMEYRTFSTDMPNSRPRYRRSSENEMIQNGYRRVYPDPRFPHRNLEHHDKSSPYTYAVLKDEEDTEGIGERGELVERDTRAPHRRYLPRLQMQPQASDIPYYSRKSDKISLSRKLAYEYSNYRNAEFNRKLGIRESKPHTDLDGMPRLEEMYRYNKSLQSKKIIYDPGEYVSMAKEPDNEEDTKVNVYSEDCDIKQENKDTENEKSSELTSSQIKQYADEEEIPIVRRSDEVTSSYEEKQN